MDRTGMSKQFLAIIVCLSLFPLISEAQDRKCSVVPAKSAGIAGDSHMFTCFAKPETLILAWKIAGRPIDGNVPIIFAGDALPAFSNNISSLGVTYTNESTSKLQFDGYSTNFMSLRKSTMKIVKLLEDSATSYYCFVWDIIDKKMLFCLTELILLAQRPSFGSTRIDPSTGIVTNVTCSITFRGSATLRMRITDSKDVTRNETVQNLTLYNWHVYDLAYLYTVRIIPERRNYHRVHPDAGLETAFTCVITLDNDFYTYAVKCEVDAPVTYAYITPQNATRCSSRTCYMHETIVCTSDGRPKPDTFEWRVSVNYKNFMTLLYQTPEQKVLDSGRNTYECRVYNFMSNYNFTTSARFTAHILAFEWYLDEYATYLSKGRSKHKIWYPLTIVVPFAAIIWVFLPCHKRF